MQNFLTKLFFFCAVTTFGAAAVAAAAAATGGNIRAPQDILAEECGPSSNNIHLISVPARSPRGNITLMQVQYDSLRAVPVTSTTFHDSMNKEQNAERKDNFRRWDCPQLPSPSVQPQCSQTFRMTEEQREVSGGAYVSWDRGHMSPVAPYRFDFTAQDNTFYCINIAPQEPRTNQVFWNAIEQAVLGRPEPGYVMTGLCVDVNPNGPTNASYTVPGCYFKLFCYLDGGSSNATRVIGYIGENSLYDFRGNGTADAIRREETTKIRSQEEVIRRFGGSRGIIQTAWMEAEKVLLTNREKEFAPKAANCVAATNLPALLREEWNDRTQVVLEKVLEEQKQLEIA